MGKERTPSSSNLLYDLSRVLVPAEYLESFEVVEVKEIGNEWRIVLHEKASLMPVFLRSDPLTVLDGFCRPLSILSHAFSLKPVFLVVYRRRWKLSNTDKHYSNEYRLTKDSARITPALADFFKIQDRATSR